MLDSALVRGIEAGATEAAFTKSHLPTTLRLAQRLDPDAVVLACTRFTTILPLITACCDLPVIGACFVTALFGPLSSSAR